MKIESCKGTNNKLGENFMFVYDVFKDGSYWCTVDAISENDAIKDENLPFSMTRIREVYPNLNLTARINLDLSLALRKKQEKLMRAKQELKQEIVIDKKAIQDITINDDFVVITFKG